jgi:uncharacterized protein
LLPESLLRYRLIGKKIVPGYLTEQDHPWLRSLINEYERFIGKPRRELFDRLREPLPFECDPWKQKLARHLLEKITHGSTQSAVRPRLARKTLFEESARLHLPREVIIKKIADQFRITSQELEDSIFADLSAERKVTPPARAPSAQELALQLNLLLAQSLLFRSSLITLEAFGHTRAVVRHAKLRGLICTVHPNPEDSKAILTISGPFSLFKKTLLYGRTLGEIVPILSWCNSYRLQAECVIRDRTYQLIIGSGDPLPPAKEPKSFDSRLEERFARDFQKLAPEWDVIREPEPVNACGTLIFPDFCLQHRRDPGHTWVVEIAGFWTPDYLAQKLKRLRDARIQNLILCIDQEKNCSEHYLPDLAHIVLFRKKIDASKVLEILLRSALVNAGYGSSPQNNQ